MPDNKLQSLTEIFNQKFFRIPDYQRGYSWEKEQLNAFWDDLQNLKEDKVHYTGLLTVKPIRKSDIIQIEKWHEDLWLFEKGLAAFYVIDGQQRLTTSIIFIRQLLDYFSEGEGINFDLKEAWEAKFLFKQFGDHYKSFIFGYEKDNPSDEYFKTKILRQKSLTSDRVPEQTLYTTNLEFAKKYFTDKFDALDKPALEELFKRLVNKFKFNFYEIDEELDEFVTFETMNNRGKKLSTLELMKNRLIYLTTLLSEEQPLKNRLRKDINEAWKTVYEFLGKNKDNPLDDDVFLFNHWIMYFKYDRSEADAYANYLLHKKFTPKNLLTEKITFHEIKKYIDSLAHSVKSWFYIYNIQYSNFNEEIKEWLQKLNRLGMGAFPPLLMAAFNKENDQGKLLQLLQAAERFIFLIFRISQLKSNARNSHFYRLSNMYHLDENYWGHGVTDVVKVTNDINWQMDGWREEEYIGLFDLTRFKNFITELNQKNEGYYSWNGLRYFLYEYELHLQRIANNNQKVSWTDFNRRKKEDTIEHIYPQTPSDACWKNAFSNVDKKRRKALLHTLGNLVLLAKAKNSSLQNKCFEYKKRHQDSTGENQGFYNGSYSEIEVASYTQWTPEEIIDRGLKMLSFMEARWNFKVSDWENIAKEELLFIN
ncbi:DUF262 domain-containing protein [Mucilaginibacter terrae]|uniref:Uncharacterized protein with ParB-like and HNH nuclease domain n=1 Tax=Mucilaginibacter terrae TaxID=1955052 RepID=A0ABU3GUJ0_9SPHI|nr:DUF262 domain-containing HNH endonuclease family protein [Mucilaginibacter terrae]MDT3403440.1 uncharacterized protein with ParB-like and HNH nuclease domain [Mucilaginibacter terrae]